MTLMVRTLTMVMKATTMAMNWKMRILRWRRFKRISIIALM
jgi:hypothetical protein